jgi:acyl dehydratase
MPRTFDVGGQIDTAPPNADRHVHNLIAKSLRCFIVTFEETPPLVRGRTWQEMPVGFRFRTSSRTITEADVSAFVAVAGITEPLFLDARVALENGYAGRLVPGMMTFSFAEGLVIQTGCIHGTGVAFLHMELDVKAPVYVGDTIGVVVEVTEQRPTSKGDRGLITTRNEVLNQRGEIVLVYTPVRLTRGQEQAGQETAPA